MNRNNVNYIVLAVVGFLLLIGLIKMLSDGTIQKIFAEVTSMDKTEAEAKKARDEAGRINQCGRESNLAEEQDDISIGLAIWTPDTRRRFVDRCAELMKQGLPKVEGSSYWLALRIETLKSIKIEYALYAPLNKQMEQEHWTATQFQRKKEEIMDKWKKSPAFAKYMEEATAQADEHNKRIKQ